MPSTEPLYALVAAHREQHRPAVWTPDGEARLWQVFRNRVAVVTNAKPLAVFFFRPDQIRVLTTEKGHAEERVQP